ncbi:hypothetical protein AHF37_08481 [Paragonimus kellicotti]|nr:hypothetical protein AHF37_08481 [Paragonimus kellicotti]
MARKYGTVEEEQPRHQRQNFCCKMFCNIPCRIVLFIINVVSSVSLDILSFMFPMFWYAQTSMARSDS